MKKLGINQMAREAYKTARSKGWQDGSTPSSERVSSRLALIHSEVSEALECVRYTAPGALKTPTYGGITLRYDPKLKPEGFMSELADIVIRVGDLAMEIGGNLEQAIREKNAFNKKRNWKHGGKRI